MNIIDAIGNKDLFAPWFRDRATWNAWRAFLAAVFALPMTADQLAIYKQCTGRTEPPTTPAAEAWLICGRRSGKSFMLALIAIYLATFRDYRQYLAPGERATVMLIACDRKQSRVIMRYIRALLTKIPALAELVERETQEQFDLTNSVTIEVHVASFRSTRGYTLAAALLDELAFWPADENSAAPDREIINALKPGMATIPGAMLLCASSPYARKGSLFDAHRKHFAKNDDPILVWQAPTRVMNPTVPQSIVDEAIEADPADASAEYMAQFRSDVVALVPREAIEACVATNVRERAPMHRWTYSAFVDPSGGRSDSMTCAIGHYEASRQTVVLDCLREFRPPFSPEAVVAELASLLKSYRIHQVQGDHYAGEWCTEQFSKFAIGYKPSAKPKSALYGDLLPLINSCRIELLHDPKLINQLCSLERRTARGGKDSIDHAPNAHDDIANACAGVAAMCIAVGAYNLSSLAGTTPDDPLGIEGWQRYRYAMFVNSGGRIRI